MREWQNEFHLLSKELFEVFSKYLKDQLIETDKGLDILDSELGVNQMASACTTLEAALALHVGERFFKIKPDLADNVVRELAKRALGRQHEDGALGQPFYVIRGQEETKDIAEVGACADALYYLYHFAGVKEAKDILLGTAKFLLSMKHPSVPGVYYKRPDAKEHDVLNGDAYAGASLMRTYQVAKDKVYHDLAKEVAIHLIERFGAHSDRWWPYSEFFDKTVNVGNSLSYQATIVAFGRDIVSGLKDEDLKREFSQTLDQAMEKILDCIEQDLPLKEVEPVWWASTWNLCPEVLLALVKERHLERARKYALIQLKQIVDGVQKSGVDYFKPPKKEEADPNRTPVTTTFRKLSTMAGILSYAYMDIIESNLI